MIFLLSWITGLSTQKLVPYLGVISNKESQDLLNLLTRSNTQSGQTTEITVSYMPGLCADTNPSVPDICHEGFESSLKSSILNVETDNSALWDLSGNVA